MNHGGLQKVVEGYITVAHASVPGVRVGLINIIMIGSYSGHLEKGVTQRNQKNGLEKCWETGGSAGLAACSVSRTQSCILLLLALSPCGPEPWGSPTTLRFQATSWQGAWVSQLVKFQTLDFDSGHDLMVCELETCIRLCADSAEPAWDSLLASLSQNK